MTENGKILNAPNFGAEKYPEIVTFLALCPDVTTSPGFHLTIRKTAF